MMTSVISKRVERVTKINDLKERKIDPLTNLHIFVKDMDLFIATRKIYSTFEQGRHLGGWGRATPINFRKYILGSLIGMFLAFTK